MTESTNVECQVVTAVGEIGTVDSGDGLPVLFVHGTPGGSDQGTLMGRFLVDAGFRVVAPSRPGYLGTPLEHDDGTPERTAALLVALLDALDIDRCGVVCWSGGGPSAYLLAADHPDRVSSLVACAAVSGPYEFATGLASLENSLMTSGLGGWLLHEMVAHTPKAVITSTIKEEGTLSHADASSLVQHIWEHPDKREFVLDLSATLSGRKVGVKNDHHHFPGLADLGLARITVPTLLVHGTADADVGIGHSEHAAEHIAGAEFLRVERGTHLAVWTDPTSEAIQDRIVTHLRG